MRLLIALQYYLPNRTGYTLHVQRIAEALAARGHQVTVLAARRPHTLAPRETIAGVDVVRLAAPVGVSRGAIMPAYPWHAWRHAGSSDAIWVNTPLLETALWAAVARARHTRLVITHHGDLALPPGRLNRFIEGFTLAAHRLGALGASALVAYSADYASASRYLAGHGGRLRVISPPIAIPRPDARAAGALRERLNPQRGPIVGFAGRFVREKRPDLLLRAALTLRARMPTLRLAFAGAAQVGYEDTWTRHAPLVAQLGDAAVFLGVIDEPQALADFYAACDVIALPSESECFGLVQAEAMLCGTPVVAADIPGARVPVASTGMGRLFEAGNAQALADALAEVIANPARYQRPRSAIAERFDLGRTIDAYEALFLGR